MPASSLTNPAIAKSRVARWLLGETPARRQKRERAKMHTRATGSVLISSDGFQRRIHQCSEWRANVKDNAIATRL